MTLFCVTRFRNSRIPNLIPSRLKFRRYIEIPIRTLSVKFSSVIIFVTKTNFSSPLTTNVFTDKVFNIITEYLYCVNFVLLWKIIVVIFFICNRHFCRVVLVFVDVSYLGSYHYGVFLKTKFTRFKWQYLASQETKIFSKCTSLIQQLLFTFFSHYFCLGKKKCGLADVKVHSCKLYEKVSRSYLFEFLSYWTVKSLCTAKL